MTLLKRLLREPLVHFLLLGGLLFLYFEWRGLGRSDLEPDRHHARPRRAPDLRLRPHLAAASDRRRAQGVDRRLREGGDRHARGGGHGPRPRRHDHPASAAAEARVPGRGRGVFVSRPPDAELKAWLEKHPEAFRAEPQLAFRQVYVSPRAPRRVGRGRTPQKLLARFRARGEDAATDGLGDAVDAARGDDARAAARGESDLRGGLRAGADEDRAGAVDRPGGVPLRPAPRARPRARRRRCAARSRRSGRRSSARCSRSGGKKELDALYERLLQKYTVTIEKPKAKPPRSASVGAGGSR